MDTVYDNKISPELDHFSSLAFEEICQQYFWHQGILGNLSFMPVNIGRWWNAKEEIDVIVLGEKVAMLIECKWTKGQAGINILEQLQEKATAISPQLAGREITFGICSRSGFSTKLTQTAADQKDVLLIDLPDLVGK